MRQHCRAFTLIELLVVVTIIVVLLALLTPALDQAVYQAELTACMANEHAIGTGMHMYALGHRRSYPRRGGVHHPKGDALQSWRDNSLVTMPPFAPAPNGYDDRPALRNYLSLNKNLVCPLTRPLDIENSIANVYSTYQLWFGFRYVEGAAVGGGGTELPGVTRLGGRLHWGGQKFNLLASDEDDIIENTQIFGAHPDRNNIAPLLWFQDADINGGQSSGVTGTGGAGGAAAGGRFTYTRWHYTGDVYRSGRGAVDRNFLREDGSANRITITIDLFEKQDRAQEHGLARAPISAGANGWPTHFTLLPTAP